MRPARLRLCLLALSLTVAAQGYIRQQNTAGSAVVRTDFAEFQLLVNEQTAPGLANTEGVVVITESSDPLAAITAATERWSAIPQSAIEFRPVEGTSLSPNGADGFHVVSFQDTPENRDVVGDATAVTLFFTTQDGIVRDSDVYFNPVLTDVDGRSIPFSTDGAEGTYDILSILLHELGHSLGLNHTNVLGATMFQFGREAEVFAATLAPDDIAFAVDVYPAPSGQSGFGRIRGTALLSDGQPIRGGAVAAVNASNGVAIGGLTDLTTGAYSILVPPGDYLVYLEPLNGPLRPANLSLTDAQVTNPFQTTQFAEAEGGRGVTVAAGGEAVADFSTIAGPGQLDIALLGIAEDGFIALGTGPRELTAPQLRLFLWGAGLENVTEEGLRLLGPDVTLVPGSVRFDPRIVVEEFNGALEFTVNVTPPQTPSQSLEGGSLTTILINANDRTAALTGALVVEAEFAGAPAFTAAGVANAASFAAGPIAPGGLISIFGLDVGPVESTAATGFDPETGLLPTELGGVRVEFDGIPAPVLFASRNQLNVQVPVEVAATTASRIVVHNGGLRSPGVLTPVAAASPGLFVVDGTQGAILNQDSTLNSPANPAPRGGAVIVFGAGQGVVSNPVATGAPARSDPLSGRDGVTATVGGVPAQVLFAGLAPGFVGLFQVNLLLTDDTPTGDAVPVVVSVDGAMTQAGVTLSVGP